LLIVSHDKQAIQSICDQAILLDGGALAKQGAPEEVMDYYNALIAERENTKVEQITTDGGKAQTISGTGEAKIESVSLVNERNESIECVNVGESVTLKVAAQAYADLPELVLGYMIKDRFGLPVFGTNTYHLGSRLEKVSKGDRIKYNFTFPANLGVGSYSVTVALHASYSHLAANYEWRDLALVFNVINANQKTFSGTAWLPPEFEVQRG
jgi:lipopolysaccharide transport system ATP-binding protein